MVPFLFSASCKQDDGYQPLIMDGDRIVFQGDSITDGNWGQNQSGERGTDPNHIFGHGYMFICAATYTAEYPDRRYDFYNRGISGNRLEDMAAKWQQDVLDLNPDIVSILIGINDVGNHLLQSKTAEDFDYDGWETSYRACIEKSLFKNPNVKFILGAPFVAEVNDMSYLWSEREKLTRELGEIVRKLANEYGAVFIPYFEMFEKAFDKAPAEYWLWDGVHPTPAGHKLMADLWMSMVGKI